MTTRIIFNGQEYPSTDAMPESVRNAYLKALELFKDTDADGIPDVLEGKDADSVISVHQSSVTFNGTRVEGPRELPKLVRRALAAAMGQSSDSVTEPAHRKASTVLDAAHRTMGVLLAFGAGFVLIFSVGLMFALGGGRDHLASRLTIAIGALLLLGWLDTYATRLAQRRRPLLAPDPPGYRRFAVWSAVGLLLAAALLLGLAWFLPAKG